MDSPYPCSYCSEAGHTAGSCPELHSPLKEGFQGGSGSGGGGCEDDDCKKEKDNCELKV